MKAKSTLIRYMDGLTKSQKADMAAACQISPEYLYQISIGFRQAGQMLARRIEAYTDGKVTHQQLRPGDFAPVALAKPAPYAGPFRRATDPKPEMSRKKRKAG